MINALKLQSLITSLYVEDYDERLCYHYNGEIIKLEDGGFKLKKGTIVSFDGYFNIFSSEKWREYTKPCEAYFECIISGDITLTLMNRKLNGKEIIEEEIKSLKIKNVSKEIEKLSFDFSLDGIIYIKLEANDDAYFSNGVFKADIEEDEIRDINIAIGICTFKREEYVKRNLNILNEKIFYNKASQVKNHLKVLISDNGQTLESDLSTGNIKIMKNKNLGGVGGFTRDIIEAEKITDTTHILLMDDDASIEPESVERTYSLLCLLKDEYKNAIVSGAMLREDYPSVQFESGAYWNKGNIKALNNNLDMTEDISILKNEIIDKNVEYAGWWYCTIPLIKVEEVSLPLPIFIHRDDIEYGIRLKEPFILLNGICVWHEPFENKMPGVLEYYDIRNLAILNAIHYSDYTKKDFKKSFFKWASGNIARYRYEYVDLNIMGAEDFLKGVNYLMKIDGEENHKKVMSKNIKAKKREEYIGYEGLSEEELSMDSYKKSDKSRSKLKKLIQVATLNGYFLPAKKGKPKVVAPYSNVYELYRQKTIIYIDNSGNCVKVEKSLKKFFSSYKKIFKCMSLISKEYDKAQKDYKDNFRKLTTIDFWDKYLNN